MGQRKQVHFNKNDISALDFYTRELGQRLKPDTWNNQCLCPFHADKKAGGFGVHTGHSGFKCHSCGAKGGDIIDYLRLLYGCSLMQAINYLEGSEACQPEKNIVTPPANHEPDRRAIRQAYPTYGAVCFMCMQWLYA